MSDDGKTVVLEHDAVPGAIGYRLAPVVRSGAVVAGKWAHTWDGSATRHRFASGFPPYTVEALSAGDTGVYPPPQPPPPAGDPIFDGRATRLTLLTGSTVLGNNNADQQPEVWGKVGDGDRSSGLYFMRDDISLASDPRYGQVYLVRTNGSSQNPYWTDTDVCSAELTHDYTLTLGQEMWGTGATRLDPANTLTAWQTLQQVAYPTLSSPPFGLYMHPDGFGVERHYGEIPAVTQQAAGYDAKTLHPWADIRGKWIEYVCGVKMTVDASGSVRVWTRVRENGETGFTLRYQASGVTFQWVKGQPAKLTVMDKMGHYWGGSGAKATWPTNRVWHRGWMRHKSQADAFAAMG